MIDDDLHFGPTFHLSDLIRIQKEAMWEVLEANLNGSFPDDNPKWSLPNSSYWDSEEEKQHEIERHRSRLDKLNALANRRVPLNKVKIDQTMVLLGILSDDIRKLTGSRESDHFILLGEIVQMPGHIVILRVTDNRMFSGLHDDNFYVVPPGET